MNRGAQKPIQFSRVADIYDDYVRTEFDLPFWLSEARAVAGKVLELTCGTGRVSIPLLKAGIDLTCVDYAPEMLARFREKLTQSRLSCPLVCQDIADLRLPDRYDLIFIPFHSFSELVRDDRRRSALRRIRQHLTEGGIFICTLQNPAVRTLAMDGTTREVGDFALPGGERLVVRSRLSFDASSQLAEGEQIYDRCVSDGTIADHRTLPICFYLFYRQQFESLAHETGFDLIALYGDYNYEPFTEGTSPFMIWKLTRNRNTPRLTGL